MTIWISGKWTHDTKTQAWIRTEIELKPPIGFRLDDAPEVLDVFEEDEGTGGEWDVSCVSSEAVAGGDDEDGGYDLQARGRRYRLERTPSGVAYGVQQLQSRRPAHPLEANRPGESFQ